MTVFKQYFHLEKYLSDEVEGFANGKVYVQPKLDGTNASIWLGEDGLLKAGSRNRQLGLGKDEDNAGFYAYVLANAELFMPLFTLLPFARLYGEFLVKSSKSLYVKDAYPKFYAFDLVIERGDEIEFLTPDNYTPILESLGIPVVPTIAVVDNYTGDWLEFISQADYLLDKSKEGAHPEGIVMKNYAFVNKYGRRTFAKLVTDEFKANKSKKADKPDQSEIEKAIAEQFVTAHLVEKERGKIELDGQGKIQPRLLQQVFHSVITESMWDIVKDFKKPTVNFKSLEREVYAKVREFARDIF